MVSVTSASESETMSAATSRQSSWCCSCATTCCKLCWSSFSWYHVISASRSQDSATRQLNIVNIAPTLHTQICQQFPRRRHRHPRRLPCEDRCEDVVLHERNTHEDPRRLVRRAIFLAWMSVRDACVYTCTVHGKLLCTRLQNYTIDASLMSVSVLVPWNSSLTD